MPTTDQLRTKLIEKLQELFQLDQPELDFGFYRIMHAKAEQVQRFLENDLLTEVQQAFADGNSAKQAELKQDYEDALAQARKFGAPDPEKVEAVQDAKGRWEAALDTTKAEAEVYDHLYRFFERYYEDGDFVSRRYLTRESAGKAAPYAVPYDGQEVMLHWANRDQYYIKTSEHFNTYTFEARAAAQLLREEAKKNKDQSALELGEDLLQGEPLRVHFCIVEAAEGEHNNVKESADNMRYFIVDGTEPLAFNEADELECRFTYRQDPDKTGQENTWKQVRNKRNEEALLGALTALAKTDKRAALYLPLVKLSAPRGAKKDERTLLGKYIEKYTDFNRKDYFIHRDLGGFLRRELDFYLKNEVLRLDDIENAEAPKVEHYLAKLRTIRRIAHKLTDFLAQLENFQKRLWLKKKFVVETNYCITLDRVPAALYPAIATNTAQKVEWEKLFHIQDLPGYETKKPLTVSFLKANPYLVLDTAFLTVAEKTEVLAALDDLDAQCNGLLIHSENFQALRLLEGRYREQVKCVYIDPPYNTGGADFIYKDAYKHSSWISFMRDRLLEVSPIMRFNAALGVSSDGNEVHHLSHVCAEVFGVENKLALITVPKGTTTGQDANSFGSSIDYLTAYRKSNNFLLGGMELDDDDLGRFDREDDRGSYSILQLRKTGNNDRREDRPNMYFPMIAPDGTEVYPIGPGGYESCWRAGKPTAERWKQEGIIEWIQREHGWIPYVKYYAEGRTKRPSDLWEDIEEDFILDGIEGNKKATRDLKSRLGKSRFTNPKPVGLIRKFLQISQVGESEVVLDFFAGSGTTGHAVLDESRGDGKVRNVILVEMGDHFDEVTKPRFQKVIYSAAWKDLKPVKREGISYCFKYIRLESYEDTLNALELRTDAEREKMLAANKELREDYTLRYLLDVETQGSASLLNHTAFTDPRAYQLNVKKPGSEERTTKTVDLLETFNYLLGLRVQHTAAPEVFSAAFERVKDADVPKEQAQRLVVKGSLKPDTDGKWWFRKVQGWMPRDRHKPHGERDKVLIIWRTLTGDLEQDNAVLDTYFTKNRIEVREKEYDVIYVNGSNNLPNLLQQGDRWKVRLIEEDFHRLMWEGAE